jgi:membrane peptidoglycan carboxypeptidase
MDKKIYLRFFYLCLAMPIILFSILLFIVNKRVRYGVSLSKGKLLIPSGSVHEKTLILLLICGEDHRFYNHMGCDPIAILRAIYRYYKYRKLEGASTIEQQYVRTCTARYEISLTRKFEEIAISTILSITSRKDIIAYSYLMQAYYGSSVSDMASAAIKLKEIYQANFTDHELAVALVSLLKSPIPKNFNNHWKKKHWYRLLYINQRYNQLQCAFSRQDKSVDKFVSILEMNKI